MGKKQITFGISARHIKNFCEKGLAGEFASDYTGVEMADKDCIFCKIVKGEIPAKKVYEDQDLIAIHDIKPLAPVHVLVIPKKHIARLSEAKPEDKILLGEIQLIAAQVARDLKIDEAFRVLLANGEKAGQSVFHIHYHVRGGWKSEVPEDI